MKQFSLGFVAALIFVALVLGIYLLIGGKIPGNGSGAVRPVQPVQPLQPVNPVNPVNPQ